VKRILIDTSIYIDWFRQRRHQDIVAGQHGPPSLSAVVAMELLAGDRPRGPLASWIKRFQKAGRLLLPGWQSFALSAKVLRQIRAGGGHAPGLTNDVLIAMTARSEGLRLYTTNARDFRRIRAAEPFDLVVVSDIRRAPDRPVTCARTYRWSDCRCRSCRGSCRRSRRA
jgi:predicted nucleic acid-binding protein